MRKFHRSHLGLIGAALVGAIAMVTLCTGCQKILFPSDLPRNQFETHDRMRQRSNYRIQDEPMPLYKGLD